MATVLCGTGAGRLDRAHAQALSRSVGKLFLCCKTQRNHFFKSGLDRQLAAAELDRHDAKMSAYGTYCFRCASRNDVTGGFLKQPT